MADEKLKNVIWYLSSVAPSLKMGAVQMMKVILFAELHSMIYRGAAIIGDNFIKADKGPVPRGWREARDELVAEGKIKVTHHQGTREQDEYACLGYPDISAFHLSPEERETLYGVASTICSRFSMDAISDLTHNDAWLDADLGGNIPIASYARVHSVGEMSPAMRASLDAQMAEVDWNEVEKMLAQG